MRGFGVLLFDPPFGEHVFFFRLQQGKLADFLHIAVQSTFRCWRWQICVISHLCPFPQFPGPMLFGLT